jgi:hypothetical protein
MPGDGTAAEPRPVERVQVADDCICMIYWQMLAIMTLEIYRIPLQIPTVGFERIGG